MKQRVCYVYQFGIMDLWEPMIPFEVAYESGSFQECIELRELLSTYLYQFANFFESYWEGDVRPDELYIGEIPDPSATGAVFKYIGLKQDNNGTTYLIFPFPMPVFAEYECRYDEFLHKQPNYHDECLDILNTYAPKIDIVNFLKGRSHAIRHHQERINKEVQLMTEVLNHYGE